MTTVARRVGVAVLVAHGLLHLLGAAKGFEWAQVSQLRQPISPGAGSLWLLAAVLVVGCAVLVAVGRPTWWWAVALSAAGVSQCAIATSFSDAKAGTVINVLLVVAAAYAFASVGPKSLRAQGERQSTQAIAAADPTPARVTDDDLAGLPHLVAAYIRGSGAVGRPRVTSLEATFHGRIRSAPTAPWMPFTGGQVNTYGSNPQRVFLMNARRAGLPVTVLHQFVDARATMRAKVVSLVPVVNAAGPEMDRGETVTVFNDLVALAPGAIPGAPIQWSTIDATHVRGVYVNGDQRVAAVLSFNADNELVDFVSQDRSRASVDGTSFVPQTWSTPLLGHEERDGRQVLVDGEARWSAPPPEGPFTYVELHFDHIAYNVDHLNPFSGEREPLRLPVPTAMS